MDATLAMPLAASGIRPRAWLAEEGAGRGCDAQTGSGGQGAWWCCTADPGQRLVGRRTEGESPVPGFSGGLCARGMELGHTETRGAPGT